jgi:hypothetical protein
VCLFLCQYPASLITIALYHTLASGNVMLTAFVLLAQECCGCIHDILRFHKNFRIAFTLSCKECIQYFDRNALNMQIALGNMDIKKC